MPHGADQAKRQPRHGAARGGIVHAGRTLTVEAADSTWRIYDDDGLLAEVARTTTKTIARFKVHKPKPPRRRCPAATTSASVVSDSAQSRLGNKVADQ